MRFSQRVHKMDASGIRKVFALTKDMQDPIDLSIGQPDFSVSQEIKDAACEAIQSDHNRYVATQGIEQLRRAVAEKLCYKNQIMTDHTQVMITSAVSGGLSVVLPCMIDQGDEVIIFDPSFVGYAQLIMLYGGVSVYVQKNDDFSINFTALEQAISARTRAIIFNTPENPTGHVSDREEVEMLVQIAKKYDLWVISDEIYEDYVYDGVHISIGSLYDQTITLGGFSKSHAMMGWRVGYVHAPCELMEQMIKVQQYTFVCAPVPFQYGACKAMQIDITSHVKAYKKKRDMVYAGLKDHYSIVRSDGAFYFFVQYPYDPELFVARCLQHDLLIVPGNVFSSRNTHFRISFATHEKCLRKAIAILQKIAQK